MRGLKSTVLAVLAASTALAVPTPQALPDVTAPASLHLEVQCGCWNLCTLEALGDPSITDCDTTCDPQFLCEIINAQTAGPTTITAAPASSSTLSKRGKPHSSSTLPFTPFHSASVFPSLPPEETPIAAKRSFPIRPTPGPTNPNPPPLAKRAPERPLRPWPACQPGETDCPPIFEPSGRSKRSPARPVKPWPACQPGEIDCPSIFEPPLAKRIPSPSFAIKPVSPITDPCPKGVICEDFGKRSANPNPEPELEPKPPVEPNPCHFGPDCAPPEGGLAKRKIPWDLTITGSCGGGGCSGEVGVTIHF